MRKATQKERERINAYFHEADWELENNSNVLAFDTIKEVASYLGYQTKNKTFEEMESMVDEHRNVWFDGEESHKYFIIVQ